MNRFLIFRLWPFLLLGALSQGATPLLMDNFNTPSYGASTFNNYLAADQGGTLATITYAASAPGGDWSTQHSNGNAMLIANAAGSNWVSPNHDFSIEANLANKPLVIQFDAWVTDGVAWSWLGFGIGAGQGGDFYSLPYGVNFVQSAGAHTYKFVISDTAGTASGFNGVTDGAKVDFYIDSVFQGSSTKTLSAGGGYLTFKQDQWDGWSIGHLDNLCVGLGTAIPANQTLTWTGASDANWDEDAANWSNGSPSIWVNNTNQPNSAVFDATGAARPNVNVALGSALRAGSITFNTAGYTIGGGTITLGGAPTWTANAEATVSSSIQGSGALVKGGGAKLKLQGSNSYSGSTTVNTGILSLGDGTNPTHLSDLAAFTIASGAQVELNFVGTDTVGSLFIAGSGPLPGGTYDSSHPLYGAYFTGTGALVVPDASGTWASLADGNWSDAANWLGATVASGYDQTATFNTGTGVTVSLDANRTIGNLVFDGADYTISGSSLLTLSGAGTPAVSVGGTRTATIGANLAGSTGLTKSGDGRLVLTGIKSYSGTTTVSGGTLELSGATTGNGQIHGSLVVSPGATVALTGGDGTGFGWNDPVTSIAVDGGTINASGSSHLGFGSAATMTLGNGATLLGQWQWNGDTLLGFSSNGDSTNTISGNLVLRSDNGTNHTFTVGDGTAAVDLQVDAALADQWPEVGWVPPSGLVKAGPGTMVLAGANTYDGNTVVNAGTLEVSASGGLRFRPTTNGSTNSVSGSATSSLSFLGTVSLDLTAVTATAGNSWTLFNLASFTTNPPTLAPAAVTTTTLGSFTEVSPGVWELPASGAKWVFTVADGKLAYVSVATDYETWAASFGLVGGPADDDDHDGLSNEEEYAFGLAPDNGASVNPVASPLDHGTGAFSYTRRDPSLTTLGYSIWYSTDLSSWTEDTGAVEGTPVLIGQVETVPVTVSAALLSNPSLFIQVRAH